MPDGHDVCGIREYFFTDVFSDYAGERKRAGTGRVENVSVRAFSVYGGAAGRIFHRERYDDGDGGDH